MGGYANDALFLNLVFQRTGVSFWADSWASVLVGGGVLAKLLLQPMQFALNTSTDGKVVANFEVTLSQANATTVSVRYQTADGTAKAGKNCVAAAGTLTFAPGETKKTVAITVLPDPTMFSDLVFSLQLSSPVEGVLTGGGMASGTIRKA